MNAKTAQKPFTIIEIRSELGAAQLGASLAPDAIRLAARKAGSDFFAQYPTITLADRNALLAQKTIPDYGAKTAKNIRYIVENCQTACNTVTDTLEAGQFPLVISADHSSAAGVIAGVKQAYPEQRLGVIWIDAHSDLHTPYTTYSGNMHGMPLGAALALDTEARTMLDKTPNTLPLTAQRQWNQLKQLGGITPTVLPQDLVLIGVRYFKPEHSALIDGLNIKLYDVAAVRKQGSETLPAAITDYLQQCDKLYISFDVDSLDCDAVSRGTGTPEPNGLYVDEVIHIIQQLMAHPKVCCLEISEVNPLLDDKGNAMAEAAWEVLQHCIVQ